jgi:hypothetical protein
VRLKATTFLSEEDSLEMTQSPLISCAGVEATTSVSRIADGDSEGSSLSCLSDGNACDAHSSGTNADVGDAVADKDSNRAAESVGCESGDPECE